MFPIGDDDSELRTVPVITYGLIALNVLVFLLELNFGDDFVNEWAFIPARFVDDPIANAPTILTAMFMHGGWMHLIGNMLYLYIFGDNVEEYFGRVRYLLFYLLSGIAATFAQFYFNPGSSIPNVGASGAIAGVLGAYILLFPRSRVSVFVIRFIVEMPAIVVIGMWLVLQLFSGVGSIARTDETMDTGGIAYMAHIGGFVAGFGLAFLLRSRDGPSRTA
ncbi:rhomboid family intramembrane serine protease [Hyphomicrobium methylovorum]|uniref:rhomboid family intramembrane serine protease n=1 Tax=Hyphomicrobium methylovorum TaxID=84 RepID=UPI0015E6FEDF|nr:rhomboid family intramembrane serine protease [Hyphomicrobium methylovorum]MBA2126412.1 rhomboid family intramembrane serine protease [Hyphomicrobium methylovorum]